MATQLMLATADGTQQNQRSVRRFVLIEQKEVRRRFLLALAFIDERAGEGNFFSLRPVGHAFQNGTIGFAHLAFAEQPREFRRRATILAHQQQTAGFSIEAMDKARRA